MYIDDLLDKVKKKFTAAFKDRLQPDSLDLAGEFDFDITKMLRQCEEAAMNTDKSKLPREFEDSEKWKKTRAGQNQIMHRIKAETRQGKSKKSQDGDSDDGDDIEDGEGTDDGSPEQARNSDKPLTEEQRQANIAKMKRRKAKSQTKTQPQSAKDSRGKKAKPKQKTVSDKGALTKEEIAKLDHSDKGAPDEGDVPKIAKLDHSDK